MGSIEVELDALIVGAGFAGINCLHHLRKRGFNVKIYEKANGLGGTWCINRYPGIRVDSDNQIYKLSSDNISEGFEWSERFPGGEELRKYFEWVDSKWDLSKDILFNTQVTEADFDREKCCWVVKTSTGLRTTARHLLLCLGFASKPYTPNFPGLENFRGEIHHSADWPHGGVNLQGKRVGVIGTGASGVQIIQEIGREVKQLTVYQRTPNLCLPMQQYKAGEEEKWHSPLSQQDIYSNLRRTFTGLGWDFVSDKSFSSYTKEERREIYENLFKRGGFSFWIAGFQEMFTNQEANDEAYQFWCEKVRERLKDPKKADLLAPRKPPHAFGTKRPCLEQYYYEIFNQDNVDVVNVRESPIQKFTQNGIQTEKEGEREFDCLILATGFDSNTGGILNIKISNGAGESLQSKWKMGSSTYLGLSTARFPNLFWTYSVHAPTAFSNGPTCIEIQSDWIVRAIEFMRIKGYKVMEPMDDAEKEWTQHVREVWANSLCPATDSWYQGANIPGKPREALNYFGGIPSYIEHLENSAKNNYKGFQLS